MLHNDYLLSDDTFNDEPWTDGFADLNHLWSDSHSQANETDFDVNWHLLPTDRELMAMEADNNTGSLDEHVIRKERRTAIRH